MTVLFRSLVVGALMIANAPGAQATDLKMLGGFPENFVFTTAIANPFMDLVKENSGGSMTVIMQGPDVVPTFEQLEPVQSGVYDLLFTHPAYHVGVTTVGLMLDGMKADPTVRRGTGVHDFIDRNYQKHGLKLISAPPAGSVGFRYFLKEPITGSPALKGRKIRGTTLYQPMIEALGGVDVVIPGGEVYSALQNGVVDGAVWSLTGAKDFKWYEVSSYMADPVFGQAGLIILMNLDAWNALSDDDKTTLEKAGRQLEIESIARFDKLIEEEKAALLDLGMEMTEFPPEEAAQLDKLFNDGVWQQGMDKDPKPVGELRELAEKAGLVTE